MPYAIWREVRRFKQEHRDGQNTKPPPLHQYRDWDEAKRIQRQLSYRLGSTLVEKSRTPSGWISLPFALAREVRAFRRERNPTTPAQPRA